MAVQAVQPERDVTVVREQYGLLGEGRDRKKGEKAASRPLAHNELRYMTSNWKKRLAAIFLVLFVVAGFAGLWRTGLLGRLAHREALVESLRSAGVRGPLLCIAVQFAQVVIFVIPGEITQFAAGYVFGGPLGFVYSIVGIMLGSAFNFFFARLVGRPVLEKMISRRTLDKMDGALNNMKGKSALFFLFLLPGAPKDAMSYGAGLSNMNLVEFVVVTGLARSPAMIASIVLGSQAYQRDYSAMILTAAVVILAIGGYYVYERRRTRLASNPKDRR